MNSQARTIPRLVIAGAASNVGKTTITAGLIAALRAQGLVVQAFKCGPDYIDPSYHERAAGRPCRNLDAWMLSDEQLLAGFARACRDADIAVIEGVMGLFDGSNWHDDRASTAQIAKLLEAPVLLVVDISGSARSAAVPVLGCQHFDAAVDLRGVALNFAGSEGHALGCAEAVKDVTGVPVLGWLPRNPRLKIPARHLGLVPGGEHQDPEALIAEIAAEVAQRFDVAAVLDMARAAPGLRIGAEPETPAIDVRRQQRPVIAVARDEAFCFYYPENLELLVEAGAEIAFFSPIHGERPAANAAGVYLGGGYPELHGAALSANRGLWASLKELHARGAPIYAECGGFMALTQALVDAGGERWAMAGLVPGEAHMGNKLAAIGYRYASAPCSNLLSAGGEELRGHEFRHSRWVCEPAIAADAQAWHVRGTRMPAPSDSGGYAQGNLLASYLHIHFGQQAGIAGRLVEKLCSR